VSAPERIWLDWPGANKGDPVFDEPPERDTQPGQTQYIRADIHEAEVARLREQASRESAIADDIEPLSSQQAAKYTDLIARLSVQKASEQEAIKAIKDLCHDNERLAVLLQKRKAEMTDLRAKLDAALGDGA